MAGLVRGLGITALKQQEIMFTLEEAVKDKKNPRKREGIIFVVVGSDTIFQLNFFFRKKIKYMCMNGTIVWHQQNGISADFLLMSSFLEYEDFTYC